MQIPVGGSVKIADGKGTGVLGTETGAIVIGEAVIGEDVIGEAVIGGAVIGGEKTGGRLLGVLLGSHFGLHPQLEHPHFFFLQHFFFFVWQSQSESL